MTSHAAPRSGAPRVRPGRLEDLPDLTGIYNHYVRDTHVTFDVEPFTVEQRRPWLELYSDTGPHRLLVVEEAGRALGWACSGRFRPKPAYLTSVETTVYLAPEAVGRGLGGLLYRELFARLQGEAVHRAYAGVALPNAASLALHAGFGFRPIGTFREVGFKFGRYWDVEWLEKEL